MLFSDITILNENFVAKEHQWVGVENDRIAYIGESDPRLQGKDFGEVYDGTNRLLMPGLYNAHAHSSMTLLRNYAENVSLHEWLNGLVWPFEAKLTREDYYWGTLLACAEMARYGVVSFSDMYFCTDERIRATMECGMKANLNEALLAFEDKPFSQYPECKLFERLYDEYHGADEGRILIDYDIHAEYTSHPTVCQGVAEAALDRGVIIHLHASETKAEHEECKQRHNGMSPLRYFESLGVLEAPVLAAHCVWIDPEDVEILKRHNVSVAHCPASNMKLGSGFAPVAKLFRNGINVCLGTDGMASNNNHDMFQDMYLMVMVEKGFRMDPTSVSTYQTLYAATRGGALAQGRTDCGLLKEGFKADLTVLDISGPSWYPRTNLENSVLFASHGTDVVLTMCDGRVIFRDGQFPSIDIERIQAEVDARTKRIIASL